MSESPDPALEVCSSEGPAPEDPSQARPMSEDPSLTPESAFGPEATDAPNAGRAERQLKTLPEAVSEAQKRGVHGFVARDQPTRVVPPGAIIASAEWVEANLKKESPAVYFVDDNGAIVNTQAPQDRRIEYAPAEVVFARGGGISLDPPPPSSPPPASAGPEAAQPTPPPGDGGVPNWIVNFGPAPTLVTRPPMLQTQEQIEAADGLVKHAGYAVGEFVEDQFFWLSQEHAPNSLTAFLGAGLATKTTRLGIDAALGFTRLLLVNPVGVVHEMAQAQPEIVRGIEVATDPTKPVIDRLVGAGSALEVLGGDLLVVNLALSAAGVKGPVVWTRSAQPSRVPPAVPALEPLSPNTEPLSPSVNSPVTLNRFITTELQRQHRLAAVGQGIEFELTNHTTGQTATIHPSHTVVHPSGHLQLFHAEWIDAAHLDPSSVVPRTVFSLPEQVGFRWLLRGEPVTGVPKLAIDLGAPPGRPIGIQPGGLYMATPRGVTFLPFRSLVDPLRRSLVVQISETDSLRFVHAQQYKPGQTVHSANLVPGFLQERFPENYPLGHKVPFDFTLGSETVPLTISHTIPLGPTGIRLVASKQTADLNMEQLSRTNPHLLLDPNEQHVFGWLARQRPAIVIPRGLAARAAGMTPDTPVRVDVVNVCFQAKDGLMLTEYSSWNYWVPVH